MVRTIGIGLQSFEKIRTQDIFYIDKTEFIKEWWESKDDVTLITRPRRFGKTLNMSMLECFFSVEYAGKEALFTGLSVWEDGEYQKLQGTYPVISLSFSDIKETTFSGARKKIYKNIQFLYNRFDFLLDGDLLNANEKKDFKKISENMDDYLASLSLKMLSDYLYRYYGNKVIILLDEYDTPMQEAYVYEYWEELVELLRGFFNSTFKANSYLERAIMTGITRVSRESVFSDLNNLEVVTTTSEKYEDAFGFTETEVFASLDEFGLSGKKQEVKDWYDGFTFGNVKDIYNPWSIINYLDKRKFASYWANTSSNSLVGTLVKEGNVDVKQSFEALLQGKAMEVDIDEQIVYSQLAKKKNAMWSLLLAGGYLRIAQTQFEENAGRTYYELALTNKEVRIMFEDMIRDWFSESDYYNVFVRALLSGDLKAMNAYMNRITLEMFSYFDTGKKQSETEPERFFHGFVLGLVAELSDRYIITSNRESGFGRYDVMLEPKRGTDVGIILEFKVQDTGEKDLSEAVDSALKQIEERAYETVLIARGVEKERIRKYGFAFCGKKVLIGTEGHC